MKLNLSLLIIALLVFLTGAFYYHRWDVEFNHDLAVMKNNEQLINNRELEPWIPITPRGLEMPLQVMEEAPPVVIKKPRTVKKVCKFYVGKDCMAYE